MEEVDKVREILHDADIVLLDRDKDYGTSKLIFEEIARLWTGYLKYHITPVDVAYMMVMFKITRAHIGKYKKDNNVDIIGYTALADYLTHQYEVPCNGN